MKFAIILCYGIFQNQENYKNYLDKAVDIIKKENPDKVIICGGFTNKKFANISEAKSVADYMISQNQQIKDNIILEEKSITTLQNIKFAAKIISEITESPGKIIFICDSIRLTKVYHAATIIMSGAFKFQINKESVGLELLHQMQDNGLDVTKDCQLSFNKINFFGINMNRSAKEIGDQIPRTLTEALSIEFPKIEERTLIFLKQTRTIQ